MNKLKIVIVIRQGTLMMDYAASSDVFFLANDLSIKQNQNHPLPEYEIVFASVPLSEDLTNGMPFFAERSLYALTGKIDTLFIGGLSLSEVGNQEKELFSWLADQTGIRRICFSGDAVALAKRNGFLKNINDSFHWSLNLAMLENASGLNQNLFSRNGNIITCAGMSAMIDLSLMLIEEDHGRELAMEVARYMVVYQRRPGNELQISSLLDQQFSGKKQITAVQSWIKSNLNENLKISVLADKAAMSPRNFSRVFLAQTGFSPGHYIITLRLESSKRYLEETDLSIEQIASLCGFGNADTMRKLYLRTFSITPYAYRKKYRPNPQILPAMKKKETYDEGFTQDAELVKMEFVNPVSMTAR